MTRPRLLLHVCCAPCATHTLEVLSPDYAVTFFFDNPNIHPEGEYRRRLADAERFAAETGTPFIAIEYDPDSWARALEGLDHEPEGGRRCEACIRLRLEQAANWAKNLHFGAFATTLSISPHKSADLINRIGRELGAERNLQFVEGDFKQGGGFQRSVALSRRHGLYRQDYCGCIYSLREREARRTGGRPTDASG
jgi:predicted adenine nucleotide alpha hydrolase (AANH) superfamily ATPase